MNFLTNTLIFSELKSFAAGDMKAYLANLAVLATAAVILYLVFTGKKMPLFSFQIIVLISLLCFGTITMAGIRHVDLTPSSGHKDRREI
jgi:amino acid transporter